MIPSGRVRQSLLRGVQLVVDGPAEWSIDDENRATLRQGKLVAVVPRQAIGFTLATPSAEIVDLGTEFEVVVEEDGVYVLLGEA